MIAECGLEGRAAFISGSVLSVCSVTSVAKEEFTAWVEEPTLHLQSASLREIRVFELMIDDLRLMIRIE